MCREQSRGDRGDVRQSRQQIQIGRDTVNIVTGVPALDRERTEKRSVFAGDVYAPSQPSAFSRSSTQERSTFPAMVAALVFSSARSLAFAAA
jgi:hypothetical protein